ncbi:MAG: GldG family protein [Clostridia bacterium]|nr:GldG family protein [Clostridia bacterium]
MSKKRTARFSKLGALHALSIVLVAALLAGVNIGVGFLPSSWTEKDLSGTELYTFSEQTEKILDELETDVTLYLLAPAGKENEIMTRFLNRYAEKNARIHVESLDPADDPAFVEQYGIDLNRLYVNSVLAASEKRHQLVGYDQIYQMTVNTLEDGTQETLAYFNGESVITSALHYVSRATFPKVYILQGHGEKDLGDTVKGYMTAENLMAEPLSLISADRVPEDAACVLIHVPKADIAPEEAEQLIAYLQSGGKVFLVTDYMEDDAMPNLMQVTSFMGMTAKTGLIMEGDTSKHLNRYPYYLLPDLSDHAVTSALKAGGYRVLLPISQPIEETVGSGAAMAKILTTSDKAYLKRDGLQTTQLEKTDEDETGTYTVGALAYKQDARFFWITSSQLLDQPVNTMVAGANYDMFMNGLGMLCDQTETLSIRVKNLNTHVLSVPQQAQSRFTVLIIGVLPALILAAGAAVYIVRKRK